MLSLYAYAAHRKKSGFRGTTHVAVLKAIESGRLTPPAAEKVEGRWQIDPGLADAQWTANTDISRGAQDSTPESSAARQLKSSAGGPSMAEAKRARAVYQAERERLAMMTEKGQVVQIMDVKQEASRLARQVRDLLLVIPARNAARLAALQDPMEVRTLLEDEIEQALRGLANA